MRARLDTRDDREELRNSRRSPFAAIKSSPTMVGAITTLIVIVAVFLAYNANNGSRSCPSTASRSSPTHPGRPEQRGA